MSPLELTTAVFDAGLILVGALTFGLVKRASPYEQELRRLKQLEDEAIRRGCTQAVGRIRRQRQAFVHGGWRAVCR